MTRPLLIDTDMGVDDALAICLALCSSRCDVRAIVSVGGNVDVGQATQNIGRLLSAVGTDPMPRIGRGLDQEHAATLSDARWIHGQDGLGEAKLPSPPASFQPGDFYDVYAETIDACDGELSVVAIGPLTNLASLLERDQARFGRIRELVIMGGAVFVPGNVEGVSEFNFYRDAPAAKAVLSNGIRTTLVALDVTHKVALDAGHLGHFGAAETVQGPLLAEMMGYSLAHARGDEAGRFIIHDAVAVGALLWPELFMQTHLTVDVDTDGDPPGRTTPARKQVKERLVSMILSVDADLYIERLMDVLCHDRFHV